MLGVVGFVGDVVPGLEVLSLLKLLFLFWLWPLAAILVGLGKDVVGLDDESAAPEPRDWIEMEMGTVAQLAFLFGVVLSVVNPPMARQDISQLLGSVVAIARHRGSLPGPETFDQEVDYRLPVDGSWTVVNGSPIKEWSHSWFPATQRYAYDFVITDEEGRTRPAGTDECVANYYCYDEPVLAPADGVVVTVRDGDPELGRGGGYSHPFKRSVTGNTVTISHAEGEYSCLAHLVPGSLSVAPGDRVERGQPVGRCGHSGNSSEPHLHFQLQDHPTFEFATGLPIRFDDVVSESPSVDVAADAGWDDPSAAGWRGESGLNGDGSGLNAVGDGGDGERDGDVTVSAGDGDTPETGRSQYVHVGQRVTHAPTADADEPEEGVEVADRQDGAAHRTDDGASTPSVPGVGRVVALGRVAAGLAIGGYVVLLGGIVGSSVSTVALGLAAITGLALAYLLGRWVVDDGDGRVPSISSVAGVVLAGAVVGTVAAGNLLPGTTAFVLGGALFLLGTLLYVGVWEYGRRRVFRDAVSTARGIA
ncbi:peptidoglycan DD-metalloendopeptidase family protein [Halovivax cerinus]|uniref:Peptidoglycan DD-metalloendopeptidase family protein n=1 Tax=Halovivax cerinus TaxID=1487865 RepID=A0ABD5NMZ4_9EURY